jgi:hypothetical protein
MAYSGALHDIPIAIPVIFTEPLVRQYLQVPLKAEFICEFQAHATLEIGRN